MSERSAPPIDRGAAWRRWQLGELAPEPSPSDEPGGDDLARRQQAARQAAERRRQAELAALRDRVRQVAQEEGYRAGLEQGYAEGHAQGLKAARQEAEQELAARSQQTLAPLEALARRFSEALDQLEAQVGDDLVALALATGRQLAGEALDSDPRQVLEIIRALLHSDPPLTGQQRLWLHPEDQARVVEHLGNELEAAGWTLQPDPQLSRGGCRVTGANGELDATWESRWESIQSQVRRRRSDADPSRS